MPKRFSLAVDHAADLFDMHDDPAQQLEALGVSIDEAHEVARYATSEFAHLRAKYPASELMRFVAVLKIGMAIGRQLALWDLEEAKQ